MPVISSIIISPRTTKHGTPLGISLKMRPRWPLLVQISDVTENTGVNKLLTECDLKSLLPGLLLLCMYDQTLFAWNVCEKKARARATQLLSSLYKWIPKLSYPENVCCKRTPPKWACLIWQTYATVHCMCIQAIGLNRTETAKFIVTSPSKLALKERLSQKCRAWGSITHHSDIQSACKPWCCRK